MQGGSHADIYRSMGTAHTKGLSSRVLVMLMGNQRRVFNREVARSCLYSSGHRRRMD